MPINKVIYQTNVFEITIQKYKNGWLLQVQANGMDIVEWREFKVFATADQYVKRKYLGEVNEQMH